MTRHYTSNEIVSRTVAVWTPWGYQEVPRAETETAKGGRRSSRRGRGRTREDHRCEAPLHGRDGRPN